MSEDKIKHDKKRRTCRTKRRNAFHQSLLVEAIFCRSESAVGLDLGLTELFQGEIITGC